MRLIFILLLLTSTLYSQDFCVTKTINPISPAPCSIEGTGIPYKPWLIQIGVYHRFFTPARNTFVYKFETEEPFYVYYINQRYTEGVARAAVEQFHKLGFCDAIAVPDPVSSIYFQ